MSPTPDSSHPPAGGSTDLHERKQRPCIACGLDPAARSSFADTDGAPGLLIWLCPLCGRAWPRYDSGDRGQLALTLSERINHR